MAIKSITIWGSKSKNSAISLKMNPSALSTSLAKNSKKPRKLTTKKQPNLSIENRRFRRQKCKISREIQMTQSQKPLFTSTNQRSCCSNSRLTMRWKLWIVQMMQSRYPILLTLLDPNQIIFFDFYNNCKDYSIFLIYPLA